MIYEIQVPRPVDEALEKRLVSTPSLPLLQSILRRCGSEQPLVMVERPCDCFHKIDYVLPLSSDRLMRDLLSPQTRAAVDAALKT